jgi:lipid-binding SYLF domain-containing protein
MSKENVVMRHWSKVFTAVLFAAALFITVPAFAQEEDAEDPNDKTTAAEKREKIDAMAKEALTTVLGGDESAKALYEKAYGYAVFDNMKLSFILATGRGRGVAVTKADSAKTYMRMGSVGLNIGLGGQKYQVIFLFENKETFDRFREKGWEADTSASAVAGEKGANAEATFRDGMAIYQITEKGLMLQADVSGTKYWKDKKLNKQ